MRLLILCLLLAGCATSAKTYTADGREGYMVKCPGSANSWGTCLEKAGELCGASGYEILDRSGEQGWAAGGGPSAAFAGSTHSRSMLISCKR